ncbi:MAG: hypothetical protein WA510_24690 [Acidobacteriaceae bacterium]
MAAEDTHSDAQNLIQENGALRAIITELLIVNQELRWELLACGNDPLSAPDRLRIR